MPYLSEEQLKILLASARRQFVYDLLLGGLYHARETWERMELLGITSVPRIAVSARMENYYALTYNKSERWKHRLREEILNLLQERIPDEILVAPMTDNLIVLLISLSTGSKESEREEIRRLLSPLSEVAWQQLGVKIRFGIGYVYNDPRLLHFSFQESVRALNLERDSELFSFAEPAEGIPKAWPGVRAESESFVQARLNWPDSAARAVARRLAQGDAAGVIAQLQAALEARLRANVSDHQEIRAVVASLELAFAVLKETFPEHRERCALEEFPKLLEAAGNEHNMDARLWLTGFGERLMHWAERYGMNENPKVAIVKAYVERHLKGDLSLKNAAKAVHLVPTYLSQLFKKATGESFSEYVSGQRLNKACQLLQSTSYSVREIAELVGFQDVNYFARVFKQRYCMTPLEFRKRNK